MRQPITRTLVRRAMDPRIAPFTPDVRLTIEVLDIREGNPGPIAMFEETNRALDFPFRLGRVSLADSWCDADGGHKIGKEWVPSWHLVLHFQQYALHTVSQRGFGQSAKVFKGLH